MPKGLASAGPVFNPQNGELYFAIKSAALKIIQAFRDEGEDLNSEGFISNFPCGFLNPQLGSPIEKPHRESIRASGFHPDFRARVEQALRVFYADDAGGNEEVYFYDLVDDFLNYVVPRVAGLENWEIIFDEHYSVFEMDLLGQRASVVVLGILQNVWDNSGRLHKPIGGTTFSYWSSFGTGDLPPENCTNVNESSPRV